MRLELTVTPASGVITLPKYYTRALSATIWKALNLPEEKEAKGAKLISFSTLFFPKRTIKGNKIKLEGKKGYFFVSSPLKPIVEALTKLKGTITLEGRELEITEVNIKDNIDFEETMIWRTFPGSGILTKSPKEIKSEAFIFPYKEGNELCEEALELTLKTKWKTLCERDESKAIRWCEDENPLEWAISNPPKVKILSTSGARIQSIKKEATALAWGGTIEVTAHTAWQRLIWDSGLGLKTGVGLGGVDVVKGR